MAFTKDQEAGHVAHITGTDAAAIMGLSPWKTPADVWMEKKHPELCSGPDEQKAEMFYWGNKHERGIAETYAERKHVKLVKPEFMVHPRIPWLGGSPDFLIEGVRRGLEAKTAESGSWNRDKWGSDGTAEIPPYYAVQTMHYMLLTSYEEWDVAALVGIYGYHVYHLFADAELQWMMFQAEEEFYKRYIVGSETPEFDNGEQIRSYIKQRYPRSAEGKKLEVNPYGDRVLKETLLRLRAARIAAASAAKEEDVCRTLVTAYMKDAESMTWTDEAMRLTYKSNKDSIKIGWKELAEDALASLETSRRKALLEKHTVRSPGARPLKVYDDKAGGDE